MLLQHLLVNVVIAPQRPVNRAAEPVDVVRCLGVQNVAVGDVNQLTRGVEVKQCGQQIGRWTLNL